MQNFFNAKKTFPKQYFELPWLILGKGPTFEKFVANPDFYRSNYNILGLNHVGELIECDITNLIDIDVYSERLFKNSTYISIPWHPHVLFRVTKKDLIHYEIKKTIPISKKILWYNCSTWKQTHKSPHKPIIVAKYFSSEAAFDLLINMGVKQIYSLGLDGGKDYATFFSSKPLRNGQATFDKQFKEINKKVKSANIFYKKL